MSRHAYRITGAVLVGVLLLGGAMSAAPGPATVQDGPRDLQQVLDQSLAHSQLLRSKLSARARARLDEVREALVGSRWTSEFGLGRFSLDDDLLVFELDGWRLPFVSLDAPEHWLVASGVYTSTGTADVLLELDSQRRPIGMSWLQRQYTFTRVEDAAFALTPEEVDGILAEVATAIREHGVDRDRVDEFVAGLTVRRDEYVALADAELLSERLGRDLRELTGDLGAGARFVPGLHDGEAAAELDPNVRKAMAAEFGGGLGVVTTVQGDIGFIEILAFLPAELSAPHLARAFKTLESARALILDVRKAVGGAPDGGHLLQAFLLPDQVEIGRLETPATGEIETVMTPPVRGAPRFLDRPVYVLTSADTLGAGEELAYTLQALGLGRVVGERTAGAAQPGRSFRVHPLLEVRLPVQRMVSASTGGNWQGRGVEPNLFAPADVAFDAAWSAAVEQLGDER